MPASTGDVTVAYLITSHTLPDQVLRLARTLRALSPTAALLVHHDPRHSTLDEPALAALDVRRIAPEPAVTWARPSQLRMLLRCVRFADEQVEHDWLVLLSGQDYPVRPLAAVERDLARSPYDGFVEGELVPAPSLTTREVDEFAARWFYAWQARPVPGPLRRRLLRAARPLLLAREFGDEMLLGRRVLRPPFSAARPCRRGSDWLTLRRPAVAALARAARERDDLLRHLARTTHPTETFPPTVLYAEPGLQLSGDTRRHMVWAPGSWHPSTLGAADVPAALASGADFARKFDQDAAPEALDLLDEALGVPR